MNNKIVNVTQPSITILNVNGLPPLPSLGLGVQDGLTCIVAVMFARAWAWVVDLAYLLRLVPTPSGWCQQG